MPLFGLAPSLSEHLYRLISSSVVPIMDSFRGFVTLVDAYVSPSFDVITKYLFRKCEKNRDNNVSKNKVKKGKREWKYRLTW